MNRKRLRMSPELLADAMKNPNCLHGSTLRSDGVPDDMRIVYCEWDCGCKCIVLVVESSEFEPVEPGSLLPELSVRFHQSQVLETVNG